MKREKHIFAKKRQKNCECGQLQPKFKVNIAFPSINISKSTLQRTLRKEGFTDCRQRKVPLPHYLQDMQVIVRLSLVNEHLDMDVIFWLTVRW